MGKIAWDETLSVEVDEIDEDHKRLVELFNLLNEAVFSEYEDASIKYIDALLEELICLTVWHFRHEERLMIRYEYEKFDEHKAEHDDLIDSVRVLQKKFQDTNQSLTPTDITFLKDWLTSHILGQDMKMGFYLMTVME